MMTYAALGVMALGLTLAASGTARADEDYAIDTKNCAGVYGALGDTRGRLLETFPEFKATNIAQIDYAGRRDTLMVGADSALKAGQLGFEVKFKNILVGDIIDRRMNHLGEVLKVQIRCDYANKLMPTFTPPAKK